MARTFFLLVLLCACNENQASAPPRPTGESDRPVRIEKVLFIGNSYTGVNDLPTVLAHLSNAEQSPVRFTVAQHTPGGATWEDHDANPAVDALIELGWDSVVLQDQSEQPWIQGGVKDALLSLDQKIHQTGAATVLYMTWPRSPAATDPDERYSMTLAIDQYYERNGEAVSAQIAPVGRAWERAFQDHAFNLYAGDGSHPNALGTYLAACVLYATLTTESPVGLGDGGLSISEADAAHLQEIAWNTLVARRRAQPPLVGSWPMSGALGSDLLHNDALAIGDAPGPGSFLARGTTFGDGKIATIPYFPELHSATITISLFVHRSDWSAPTPLAEILMDKVGSFRIQQNGGVVYGRVVTTDSSPHLSYAVDGLSSGWHHFAMTYDGAEHTLWVDGYMVDSGTWAGELGRIGVLFPVNIGALPNTIYGPQAQFKGALAGIEIFEKVLSEAEIQAAASQTQRE